MLAIKISETIRVDHTGCGHCCQEVSYFNPGERDYEFLGTSPMSFDRDCLDFNFADSKGDIQIELVDIKSLPHHKELLYTLSGILPPQKTSAYKLNYTWPNFRDEAGFKRISTTFDYLANYNLTIVVEDDDPFRDRLIRVKDGEQVLGTGIGGDCHVTDDGNLFISRQNLSPNSKMDIIIIAKILKIDLPVIRDLASDYPDCLAHSHVVFCVIHLLRDSLPFFDNLLLMGVDKEEVFIVGIPYSSKTEVVEHLQDDGFNVTHLEKERYLDKFMAVIKERLLAACQLCEERNKKLLIIEDGGYAVPLLHDDDECCGYSNICVGAVEQTANGIWADQAIAKDKGLSFPVMNVAESGIKRKREAPLVGTAIMRNINRLLEGYGTDLNEQIVGQIGYGSIGRSLALRMAANGVDVTVYDSKDGRKKEIDEDIDNKKDLKAAESLDELMAGKTLIVGCTGEEVVGLSELRMVDRNIFFVNATSKLRELKYREFINIVEELRKKKGIGTEYKLKGGREIIVRLLADGFPVNFFETSESIPDQKIQFIPALLLGAAGHLVSASVSEKEIIDIPEALEERLKSLMKLYATAR